MNHHHVYQNWITSEWESIGFYSRILVCYAVIMALLLIITLIVSMYDLRVIRDVGVWVKPMKFMSATSLFALTTVWVVKVAQSHVDQTSVFGWIVALLISTSLFEVIYISYQASKASASHYNVDDPFHAFMFGLMAIAAVGLTGSQAWLGWEIWNEQKGERMSVEVIGVIVGLVLTFVLSTISGFMLGGNQPPSGQGLPIVGWHLHKDIRPAHFLGVHAQQLIPIFGIWASKYMGSYSQTALLFGSITYVLTWLFATWCAL